MAIPHIPTQRSAQGELSRGLGTGLTTLLGGLAKSKLQSMQQQNLQQQLQQQGLPGALSLLQGPAQAAYIRNMGNMGQGGEQFSRLAEQLLEGKDIKPGEFSGLSPKEIMDLSNLSIKREEGERRERERGKRYSTSDNEFIKNANTATRAAEVGTKAIDDLLAEIDDPEITWGRAARAQKKFGGTVAESNKDTYFDSLINNFVKGQFAKEMSGSRAGKAVIDQIEKSKITRGIDREDARKRLMMLKDEMKGVAKESSLISDIQLTDMRRVSANYDKIRNIMKKLPQAGSAEYPDGDLLRYKGYVFEVLDDEWKVIGKEK